MSDAPFNPVDIERKIEETKNRLAKSVTVVSELLEEALAKQTAFDEAYSHAYLKASEFPFHERKHRATLATIEERRAAEVADVAHKHADRLAKSLEKELFAWQTISNSVVAMFGAVRR